jgi:Ca2+/Na+ antiporter
MMKCRSTLLIVAVGLMLAVAAYAFAEPYSVQKDLPVSDIASLVSVIKWMGSALILAFTTINGLVVYIYKSDRTKDKEDRKHDREDRQAFAISIKEAIESKFQLIETGLASFKSEHAHDLNHIGSKVNNCEADIANLYGMSGKIPDKYLTTDQHEALCAARRSRA